MLKKVIISALLVLAVASAAWAQPAKVEITGLFGYTFADGVSAADPIVGANGQVYDRADPKDSAMFGLGIGFFVTPSAEVGFLWRRQATSIEVSGTTTTELGDTNIDGYHGYFAYYFGDPEGKTHPYILFGLGATNYGGVTYTKTGGGTATTAGGAQFSSTVGAGLKVNAGKNFAVKLGFQWTPTYIKSDAEGWWCDPWWGCWVVSDAQYSNQVELTGGIVIRF